MYPWEGNDAKHLSDYTWEEFESLIGEQQIAFKNAFVDPDGFLVWFEKVHG